MSETQPGKPVENFITFFRKESARSEFSNILTEGLRAFFTTLTPQHQQALQECEVVVMPSGSVLRGTAAPGSDIDLAIFYDEPAINSKAQDPTLEKGQIADSTLYAWLEIPRLSAFLTEFIKSNYPAQYEQLLLTHMKSLEISIARYREKNGSKLDKAPNHWSNASNHLKAYVESHLNIYIESMSLPTNFEAFNKYVTDYPEEVLFCTLSLLTSVPDQVVCGESKPTITKILTALDRLRQSHPSEFTSLYSLMSKSLWTFQTNQSHNHFRLAENTVPALRATYLQQNVRQIMTPSQVPKFTRFLEKEIERRAILPSLDDFLAFYDTIAKSQDSVGSNP